MKPKGPHTSDCENCGPKWHGANFKGVSLCQMHEAAPELLAALKLAEASILSGARSVKAEEKIAAAIAKAEGK